MFIAADENTLEITKLINSSKKIDCAVAFLGGKAPELLGEKGGRVICNLDSNGTNPYAVGKLLENKKFEVRKLPDIHAKIYIGDSYGIVSSSNLSANGLGLEDDEIRGWREAGYKVTDKNEVSRMSKWFEELWAEASAIDIEDLELAKNNWLEHRKNRSFPSSKKNKSFLDALKLNPSNFQDRDIYLTITTEVISDSAHKALADVKANEPSMSKVITVYEDWSNLPKGARLIDLYVELKNGKLVKPKFLEISRIPTSTDPLCKVKTKKSLLLCYKEDNIFGYMIDSKDKKNLEGKVQELWSAKIGKVEDGTRLIKIEDAFEILNR